MAEQVQVRVEIRGVPHAQPRARHVPGQKRPVSTVGPRVKKWRLAIGEAADAAAVDLGDAVLEQLNQFAVRMDTLFLIPVAKGNEEWIGLAHWHKPDRDNLEKAVMDELQKARLLFDDCRVASGSFEKRWCAPAHAGCVVVLTAMEGPPIGCKAREVKAGKTK